mgnify:CR=1 FL=1
MNCRIFSTWSWSAGNTTASGARACTPASIASRKAARRTASAGIAADQIGCVIVATSTWLLLTPAAAPRIACS